MCIIGVYVQFACLHYLKQIFFNLFNLQTYVHTHKHCFITSICVSTDLLKVANSIIIFSLTNLIWGGAENYPFTPPIP